MWSKLERSQIKTMQEQIKILTVRVTGLEHAVSLYGHLLADLSNAITKRFEALDSDVVHTGEILDTHIRLSAPENMRNSLPKWYEGQA